MRNTFLLVINLLCGVFLSCNVSETEPTREIDKSLIGTWYYKTIDSSNYGPKEFICGIQIDESGIIKNLAIESSSGTLSFLRNIGKISYAANDHIEIQTSSQPSTGNMTITYSLNYRVDSNKIYFTPVNYNSSPLHDIYYSTNIGVALAEPVLSYFKWSVNSSGNQNYILTNNSISPSPSAYAYRNDGNLVIKSTTESLYSKREFRFEISDFKNEGEYGKSKIKFNYLELNDDIGFEFDSEKDSLQISILINSIDEKRLIGTFNMTLYGIYDYEKPRIFTDGEFIIPIY